MIIKPDSLSKLHYNRTPANNAARKMLAPKRPPTAEEKLLEEQEKIAYQKQKALVEENARKLQLSKEQIAFKEKEALFLKKLAMKN